MFEVQYNEGTEVLEALERYLAEHPSYQDTFQNPILRSSHLSLPYGSEGFSLRVFFSWGRMVVVDNDYHLDLENASQFLSVLKQEGMIEREYAFAPMYQRGFQSHVNALWTLLTILDQAHVQWIPSEDDRDENGDTFAMIHDLEVDPDLLVWYGFGGDPTFEKVREDLLDPVIPEGFRRVPTDYYHEVKYQSTKFPSLSFQMLLPYAINDEPGCSCGERPFDSSEDMREYANQIRELAQVKSLMERGLWDQIKRQYRSLVQDLPSTKTRNDSC